MHRSPELPQSFLAPFRATRKRAIDRCVDLRSHLGTVCDEWRRREEVQGGALVGAGGRSFWGSKFDGGSLNENGGFNGDFMGFKGIY